MYFFENLSNEKCASKAIFFNEKKIERSKNFWNRQLTFKVRILQAAESWGQEVVQSSLFKKVFAWNLLTYAYIHCDMRSS